MFFEISNTTQCSVKLIRKRLLVKNLLSKNISEGLQSLERINSDTYFEKSSFQVIELKIVSVEDYVQENFSF